MLRSGRYRLDDSGTLGVALEALETVGITRDSVMKKKARAIPGSASFELLLYLLDFGMISAPEKLSVLTEPRDGMG